MKAYTLLFISYEQRENNLNDFSYFALKFITVLQLIIAAPNVTTKPQSHAHINARGVNKTTSQRGIFLCVWKSSLENPNSLTAVGPVKVLTEERNTHT